MTESPIEQRLRRGLAGAAATLPPKERAATTPPREPAPSALRQAPERPGRRRRRWPAVVGVAAAATLIVGIAAAVMLPDRDQEPSVAVADKPDSPDPQSTDDPTTTGRPTTIPADQVRVTNGRVPGEAVAVDGEIRLYGPDGTQTGTVSLAPLTHVDKASSDLNGGWVVCGTDGVRRYPDHVDEEMKDLAEDRGAYPGIPGQLMWFPAEGDPVLLEDFSECLGGFQVIDSVYGPMVVRYKGFFTGEEDDQGVHGVVLATGETHRFQTGGGPFGWSATSDRLLLKGPDRLQLYDLVSGDELPIADIQVAEFSDFALASDGASVAVAYGAADGPVELIVYDLATGNELYRDSFPLNGEGLELSYDGVTVAIGSYYPDVGPVTVIDVESGAQHTIDAHGTLL